MLIVFLLTGERCGQEISCPFDDICQMLLIVELAEPRLAGSDWSFLGELCYNRSQNAIVTGVMVL